MEFQVRRLVNSDQRRISEFAEDFERNGLITDAFWWPPQLLVAEFYTGTGWGAFDGDLLIGYVLYRTMPDVFEISTLATRPEYQGQGVMARLLKQMQSELVSGQEIWLEVHEDNLRAQKVYKNSGFVQTGRRPRYYRDGKAALLFAWKAV